MTRLAVLNFNKPPNGRSEIDLKPNGTFRNGRSGWLNFRGRPLLGIKIHTLRDFPRDWGKPFGYLRKNPLIWAFMGPPDSRVMEI